MRLVRFEHVNEAIGTFYVNPDQVSQVRQGQNDTVKIYLYEDHSGSGSSVSVKGELEEVVRALRGGQGG